MTCVTRPGTESSSPRRVGAAALLAVLLASAATADYVVFADGRHLKVDAALFVGREVEVRLSSGGMMRFDASGVRYVTTDADVEASLEPPASPAPGSPTRAWSEWTAPGYVDMIRSAGERHGVDPGLLAALIRVESDFRPHAVSPRGAQGLMQLMPATAAEYELTDAFDPVANVDAGTRHLKGLLDRYPGQPQLALAAYNAGAGAVSRYGGVPPYRETTAYVDKVLALWGGF